MNIIKGFRGTGELSKRINEELKNPEDYGTGLVGEQLIIAAYKTMPIDKLESLRFILNRIIRGKKKDKFFKEAVDR